jgi:hypothetical protein
VAETIYPTPGQGLVELEKRVHTLEQYVAQTIRNRESARITQLENEVYALKAAFASLDNQIRDLQGAMLQRSRRTPLEVLDA